MVVEKTLYENQQQSSEGYAYDSEKVQEYELATSKSGGNSVRSYSSGNVAEDLENNLQSGTKRGLDARHIQMISLGGAIGYIHVYISA